MGLYGFCHLNDCEVNTPIKSSNMSLVVRLFAKGEVNFIFLKRRNYEVDK
jgi:hypothetical protein